MQGKKGRREEKGVPPKMKIGVGPTPIGGVKSVPERGVKETIGMGGIRRIRRGGGSWQSGDHGTARDGNMGKPHFFWVGEKLNEVNFGWKPEGLLKKKTLLTA